MEGARTTVTFKVGADEAGAFGLGKADCGMVEQASEG
jgi:hypothetical protein